MTSLADRTGLPTVTTWNVSVVPPVQGDAAWRSRVVAAARRELERRLPAAPTADSFEFGSPIFSVRLRRESGVWRPGTEIRLAFAADEASRGTASATGKPDHLVQRDLPDDRLRERGDALVGLEAVWDAVLLRLWCAWDGELEHWSERTGTPVPTDLQRQLAESVPLFILAGDPGTGKSAFAQAAADSYCRDAGVTGHLFWLGTEARGNGLVGDFGGRVRAAFEAVRRVAATEPCFLIIDEADSLAMRRSEVHAHQEDRAGTATLLQCLDGLRGNHRVCVFLTTNLPETIDPAARRRGTVFEFTRPDLAARCQLLTRWLPKASPMTLYRAAAAAGGMTPADIEGAATRAWLSAVAGGTRLSAGRVIDALKRGERTGRV